MDIEKNNRVIVAGHACIDITPKFPTEDREQSLSGLTDILSPGRLIQMKGVDINPGGAVSNTGLAMKILGENVSLAAKIGNDSFGDMLVSIYDNYGAKEGIIRADGERTSYSCVLAVPGFDRIFLHDPGANDTFSLEDIKKLNFDGVKLFHFGYPPLMKRMYKNNGQELIEIFKYVHEKGIITSLDMTFVDEKSEAGKADWENILKQLLPFVDFFLPSVEETCWMIDRERYYEWVKRAKGDDICLHITKEDIKPLAEKIMEMGAKVLLLKCGAPGLYYKTADKDVLEPLMKKLELDTDSWSDREGFEISYKPERVLSGTGAGDTTIATFLTCAIRKMSLDNTVKLASAQGASCVEEYGAIEGIKSIDELIEKINSGWIKNSF